MIPTLPFLVDGELALGAREPTIAQIAMDPEIDWRVFGALKSPVPVSNLATVWPSQAAPQGQGRQARRTPQARSCLQVAGHGKTRESKFELFCSYPNSREKKHKSPPKILL